MHQLAVVYCVWRHLTGSMRYLAVCILCLASPYGKHAPACCCILCLASPYGKHALPCCVYTVFGVTLREACATLLCVYCVWRHLMGSMRYLAVCILCLASPYGKHVLPCCVYTVFDVTYREACGPSVGREPLYTVPPIWPLPSPASCPIPVDRQHPHRRRQLLHLSTTITIIFTII